MIRVSRGPEPALLATERPVRLTGVRLKRAAGTFSDRDLVGYEFVRDPLWVGQFRKCAYCEAPSRAQYEDVEHFRPKGRAVREDGSRDEGYWWLTWTWENLLFACAVCNRSHKRDRFFLEAGSAPLTAEQQPKGHERAVLIDPADPTDPDPMNLIQFVRVAGRWRPTGRDGSGRGGRIVQLLGLDGPEHLDRTEDHVNRLMMEDVDSIREAIALGDRGSIDTAWDCLIRHARPERAWSALAYDVIDHFVPWRERHLLGLNLPRP